MRWKIELAALVVMAIAATIGLKMHDDTVRALAATESQLHDAHVETKKWQAWYAEAITHAAQADTVYVRQRARVDSIRDTIPLWRHDTTYITQYVERTNAALGACDSLRLSCTVLQHAADSTIAAVERERDGYHDLWRRDRPDVWKRFGVCGGYGVTAMPGGQFAHGVQVGACVRLFP